MYAEHDGDVIRVEKELYGDVFRRPPKLTPLEARAIRLAIEYVGPTIAAEAHTPLKRVRKKLEDTFGRFDLVGTPAPSDASAEEGLVRALSDGADKRIVVEIEYLKEGDDKPSLRGIEPYTIERELPVWRVHTWDRTVDGARTFRLDRMRSATLTDERFEPRDGFDPSYLSNPRVAGSSTHRRSRAGSSSAVPGHSPTGQRQPRCRTRRRTGSSPRCSPTAGRPTVLEPQRLRDVVAKRARRLQRELDECPAPANASRHRNRSAPTRIAATVVRDAGGYRCRTSTTVVQCDGASMKPTCAPAGQATRTVCYRRRLRAHAQASRRSRAGSELDRAWWAQMRPGSDTPTSAPDNARRGGDARVRRATASGPEISDAEAGCDVSGSVFLRPRGGTSFTEAVLEREGDRVGATAMCIASRPRSRAPTASSTTPCCERSPDVA